MRSAACRVAARWARAGWWLLLLVCCLIAIPGPARATVEPTLVAGWTASRWATEQGLPLDSVTAVDFDPDGLVWIATFDGLARFDGVAFEVHRPGTHPGLPSARITDLAIGADGTRWLVTETGDLVRSRGLGYEVADSAELGIGRALELLRWDGGLWLVGSAGVADLRGAEARRVVLVGMPDGLEIRGIAVTSSHGLLVIAQAGPVLDVDLTRGRATIVHPLVPAPNKHRLPQAVTPDDPRSLALRGDVVLVVAENTLLRVTEGRDDEVMHADQGELALRETADGRLLLLTDSGPLRVSERGVSPLVGPLGTRPGVWWTWQERLYRGDEEVLAGKAGLELLAVDPAGGAWVAQEGAGLLRVHRSTVQSLRRDDLGELGPVSSLAAARGGGLWLVAREGLRRYQSGRSRFVVDDAGEVIRDAVTLVEDAAGVLWVSRRESACQVRAPTGDGLPADGPVTCKSAGERPPWGARVSMWAGPDGALWAGSREMLRRRPGGTFERVFTQPAWMPIRALAEASDGSILVASIGGGLRRIDGDRIELRASEPGSPLRAVRSMLVDAAGDAWLGTEGLGLCRLRLSQGPFADAALDCLDEAQGLADPFVNSLASDARGRLWMSSNRGLHTVDWSALVDRLEGRREDLPMLSLGPRDGMVEPETNGMHQPGVVKTPDGVLWYPTMDGIARLDPADVAWPEPPAVVIDALRSPKRSLLREEEVALAPEERELTVRWTARGLDRPEALRFRYRLGGLDTEWRGPTTARTATWTTLPPGSYVLEIQAGIAGRWGPVRQVGGLDVPPTFRETSLFTVLVWLLGALVVAVFAWGRVRQSRRRADQLQRAVDEATEELEARNQRLTTQSAALAEQRQTLETQARTLEAQNTRIAGQAERLEQLDRVRTRFVANISHELRTPLTLILGTLEQARGELPDTQQQPLRVAQRNAHRLADLVEQLLDVARLDAGGVPLRARRIDLARWLARVGDRFEAGAAARGVALRLAVAESVAVWFDPDLMDKVLTNLLGNGLDYCPRGGWLALSLTVEGDDDVGHAVIRVTDTGPGVPEHQRERLFDRFFQVDDSDRRARGGAGIGLALAREIVDLHGGTIQVDNVEDAGACFSVRLPLGSAHLSIDEVDLTPLEPEASESPDLGSVPSEPAAEAPADGELPLALVVEDHPDMRAFVAEQLRAAFRVEVAVDGVDALERLEGGLAPAVVVTDVMMPRLDGLGLCQALRADERWRDLPVLVLSAKATDDDKLAGLELADDYLTKPFRSSEMVLRARKLADRAARPSPAAAATEPEPEPEPQRNPFLERLLAIVTERQADTGFGVAQLARQAGLSPRQLQRRLREEADASPAVWLRTRRLEAARAMMRTGEVETVGEAAAAVGMSRSYLARVYQGWAGHPPSDDLRRPLDASVGGALTWYNDADGDGAGDPALTVTACTQPAGSVANADDACPAEDATGYDANLDGCLDDTDGDGVTDDLDTCPATEAGTDVDAAGCPLSTLMCDCSAYDVCSFDNAGALNVSRSHAIGTVSTDPALGRTRVRAIPGSSTLRTARVEICPGTFSLYVSETNLIDGLEIVGAGAGVTTLLDSSFHNGYTSPGTFAGTFVQDLTIRDTATGGDTITDHWGDITLTSVEMIHTKGVINSNMQATVTLTDCYLEDVTRGTAGVAVTGGWIVVTDTTVTDSPGIAFQMGGGRSVTFDNAQVLNSGTADVVADGDLLTLPTSPYTGVCTWGGTCTP